MARMRLLGAIIAGALVVGSALPAAAAETTTLTVDSTTPTGGALAVSGTIAFGDDATGPITIGTDGSGDASVSGVGLDFGEVTIAADPAGSKLTYGIQVHDMPPGAEQSAPFFGYTLPIQVNADDSNGWFLAAGNAGANFPPATGPFWSLCTAPEGSYTCSVALQGTMDGDGITITLPYFRAGIEPGSVVEPGAAAGCGGGVCSTLWAGVLFNNTGGDSGFVDAYTVPGEVEVGIAPAGTPPGSVETTTITAADPSGTWTTALPDPGPGDHVVVARSCWGNAFDKVCAEGSTTITI